MSTDPDKPKKIIIDEDWKTRVQAEREAAKQKQKAEQTGESADAEAAPEQPAPGEIPPASFVMLATTIATQAMVALGFVPAGEGEQPMVRLDIAKHHIDTLAVLEDKTKGNLTKEESAMMTDTLHQLRMAYLSVANAPPAPAPPSDA